MINFINDCVNRSSEFVIVQEQLAEFEEKEYQFYEENTSLIFFIKMGLLLINSKCISIHFQGEQTSCQILKV